MTQSRTIRRSVARDLPPSADAPRSSVTFTLAGSALPTPGSEMSVATFCGVRIRALIESVDPEEGGGWSAWGRVLPGFEQQLKAAGVPAAGPDDKIRIFDWQIIKQANT